MSKIKDVLAHLESYAPLNLQESYDNSGLLVGDSNSEVTGILISLDSTEEVVEEAIQKKCNLIISHHPIIFGGLKSLTGSNYVERTVIEAIRNDIAIYAIHTNLDNVATGVNARICHQLGIENTSILKPKSNLRKLVTFIPASHLDSVMSSVHAAGAGSVGDYSECSFKVLGTGTFRPNDVADPHVGTPGSKETVEEYRVEIQFSGQITRKVIDALKQSHPYEEVAYYLQPLENQNREVGAGMIGSLSNEMSMLEFMGLVKERMHLQILKHTRGIVGPIKKVAVCGGSGSFLIGSAMNAGADAFISSDIKYHEYFDAEDKLLILDIGHYESEVFTKDLLHDILCENFTTFAVNLSETVTNPISYF